MLLEGFHFGEGDSRKAAGKTDYTCWSALVAPVLSSFPVREAEREVQGLGYPSFYTLIVYQVNQP